MSKVTLEYTIEEAARLLEERLRNDYDNDEVKVVIGAHWPTLDLVPIQILNLLHDGKVDEAINYANDLHAATMSMYEVKEWIDSLQKRFFKPAPVLLNIVPMSILNAISDDRMLDATAAAAKYFNFSSTAAKDYVYNLREAHFMYFHKIMTKRNG